MTEDTALDLALEALEREEYRLRQTGQSQVYSGIGFAITAIKQARSTPVQERTDYAVHLNHCNIGECEGVCKYLDDDCPALKHADMKAKWDRPTPPAAQPARVAFEVGLVEWVGNKLMATPKTTTTPPASWMEMVTANLVREGINKHKARELSEHFYSLKEQP